MKGELRNSETSAGDSRRELELEVEAEGREWRAMAAKKNSRPRSSNPARFFPLSERKAHPRRRQAMPVRTAFGPVVLRVAWHEEKLGVFHRPEQNAGGQLTPKVVVSCPGSPVELGERLHWEARRHARRADELPGSIRAWLADREWCRGGGQRPKANPLQTSGPVLDRARPAPPQRPHRSPRPGPRG